MNQHSEIRGVVRRSNAMRKYGVLILVAAVFCAILAVTPRTAHACSCEFRPLSEYADDVELAFAGRQLRRIVPASNEEAWKPLSVTLVFQVDQVYKGRAGPQVEVRTNQGSAACGLDLSGAGVTGIAAFPTKEGLGVGSCGSPVTIAELEEVFGEGYPADLKAEAWDPGDDVWTPATNSTSPPATNSTSPPATNSTSPPATNSTSPPATNSTSPPATNSTSPPLASQEPDTKHLPNEEGPIRILIVAGTIVILGGGAVVFLKRRRTQE